MLENAQVAHALRYIVWETQNFIRVYRVVGNPIGKIPFSVYGMVRVVNGFKLQLGFTVKPKTFSMNSDLYNSHMNLCL